MPPNTTKPGARKSFWNSEIWPTVASWGPVDEREDRKHERGEQPTIESDDHGAHDAQSASDPAKEGQGLLEEYGREDGAYHDGQRAERRLRCSQMPPHPPARHVRTTTTAGTKAYATKLQTSPGRTHRISARAPDGAAGPPVIIMTMPAAHV